jgi:hypothetical protein
VILSERRTSHSSFQFIATSPTQEYEFSISDLVPGKSYYLLVTSDNSNPGSLLFSEKFIVPYSIGDDYWPEFYLDASLFVGPFGDFTIKAGKSQRGKPK